ncbi:MAG: hypothetical protein JRE14_14460 [Deltaproteobacteria bacterium]|nr:hypothetical protein [Deltaproteobacteria bacterium]
MIDALGWIKWTADKLHLMGSINPLDFDLLAYSEMANGLMKEEAENLYKIRESFVEMLEKESAPQDAGTS